MSIVKFARFQTFAACTILGVVLFVVASLARGQSPLDLAHLCNPVWATKDNLRDPSVLKVEGGYRIFYSRLGGKDWGSPESWSVAGVFTPDFRRFEDDRDVSPRGFASPGDVVSWHGRYLLPYQSYPASPSRLCYSESTDRKHWSKPSFFLDGARQLAWNTHHRAIDPTLVVDGEVLHCWFVGSADHTLSDGKKVRANLLGHAITRDPKLEKWEILSRDAPVLGQGRRAPDGVENVAIFKTGEHWTMIYSEGLAEQHLALAVSDDLRQWRLEGPLDLPRQAWMQRKYGAPFVWRDGDRWIMILMGENQEGRTTFGLLSSADGRAWKLLPERY